MKTLNKLLCVGAVALSLGLAGCTEYRNTISNFKSEKAEVGKKEYVPNRSGIVSIPSFNGNNFSIQPAAVASPEEWNISFYGKVSFKFNNKEIFEKFELGEDVKITYLEYYYDAYEDKDKDRKKELVDRQITGYEFICVDKLN